MDQRLSRQIAELTGSEATLRVEIFNQLGRFEEHFDARFDAADRVWATLITRLNKIDERLERMEAGPAPAGQE
jgi:hypothetical protein